MLLPIKFSLFEACYIQGFLFSAIDFVCIHRVIWVCLSTFYSSLGSSLIEKFDSSVTLYDLSASSIYCHSMSYTYVDIFNIVGFEFYWRQLEALK